MYTKIKKVNLVRRDFKVVWRSRKRRGKLRQYDKSIIKIPLRDNFLQRNV